MGKAARSHGRNGMGQMKIGRKNEVSKAVRDITPLLTSFRHQQCHLQQRSTHARSGDE